jgi:hypothetical protein
MKHDPICRCGHPLSMHDTTLMLMGCDAEEAVNPEYAPNPRLYPEGGCCCSGFNDPPPAKVPECHEPSRRKAPWAIGLAVVGIVGFVLLLCFVK